MVQKPEYSSSSDVTEHGSRSDRSKSQKNGRVVEEKYTSKIHLRTENGKKSYGNCQAIAAKYA